MADMKSNALSAFFSNPKMRIIIAAVIVVGVVVGGVVAWRVHLRHEADVSASSASISQAPSLQSIPGAKQTSDQYSQDVQSANLKNEQDARSSAQSIAQGGSAVPTISQPGLIGGLDQFDTMPDGRPTCPMKVVKVFAPDPTACTVANLSSAHQSGVLASELRCQGCTCSHLKAAGYQAADLKAAGFAVQALSQCGFDWAQLRAAGFTAAELKAAGANAADLKAAGFSAAQLKDAGYSAKDLLDSGFAPKDLANAGYSAKDLLGAGVSATDLKNAGFSAAQLAAAGVSAADLAKAGFSPDAIKAALAPTSGVCSISAIKKARDNGASVQSLLQKGCSIAALKAAGVTAAELKAAGVSAADLKSAGYSAKDLKDAGFSPADLKAAGFSAAQLKNAGFDAKQLKDAGYNAADLKNAGYSAAALKDAGFSAADLKKAGFAAGQLKDAGFSAADLQKAGFSAKQLKDAGYSAGDLVNAGYSPKALADAGFTKGDLMRAGLSPADVGVGALPTGSDSGICSVQSLRKDRLAGVSANAEADKGCSLAALKAAGYGAQELLNAGFTPTQLHDAGFTAAQLAAAGATTAQLKAAGYTASAPTQTNTDQNQDTSSAGTIPSALDSTPAGRLQALQMQQQAMLARTQLENKKQQIYSLLDSEASELLRGWAKPSSQQYVAGKSDDETGDASGSSATPGQPGAKGSSADSGSSATDDQVIKAGTIMFGLLTTGINTDEQSPILAKIISGKLKGSTLMGTFTRKNTKVMLTFTKLNMPGQKNTISFDAVAIDPNTARTVVAGHVNNHYLLKYGSMFASGFLGSIGNALSSTNKVCFGGTEGCINVSPTSGFSTTDQVLIGLGGVGTKLGDEVGTKEDTQPTVTVPAGTSIGLLLMSDFTVPKSNEPKPIEAPSDFNHQAHAN